MHLCFDNPRTSEAYNNHTFLAWMSPKFILKKQLRMYENPTQAPPTNDFKPNLLLTLGKNQINQP